MNKQRGIAHIVLILGLILLFSGCVQKPKDSLILNTQKTSAPNAVLKLHLVTEDYPPYGFIENGELKGIAVEIVQELFKRLNVEAELELLPWTRALKMTELGEVDGIFTTFYSEERAVYLDYIKEPLAYEAQYVYYRADRILSLDKGLESLKPYKIGTVQDYFLGEAFEKAKREGVLKLEQTTTMEANVQKLLDGRIDVIIDHHYSTLFYLKKMKLLDRVIEYKEPFRQPESLHLCFSKAKSIDPKLLQKINEELIHMKKDGTYDKIVNHYIQ